MDRTKLAALCVLTLTLTLTLLLVGCAKHYTVYIPVLVPSPGIEMSDAEKSALAALERVGMLNTQYRHELEARKVKNAPH